MSLKLIRAAIRATTTNPEILIAEEVKAVIKAKGLPVVESHPSLTITKSDYNRWLAVVLDEAKQRGLVLTTNKADFEDIAMNILDNDPKIESQPGVQKEDIVNTMWHAFQATRGHATTTQRVKKAQEDEEQSGFAQAFKSAQGVEDEQKSGSLVKAAVGGSDTNPYEPGTLRHTLWTRLRSEKEEVAPEHDDESALDDDGTLDNDAGTDSLPDEDSDLDSDVDADSDVDTSAADDEIEGAEDMDLDADDQDEDEDTDPEEVLANLSTDELEAELARRRGEEGDDEDVDGEDDAEVPGDDVSDDAAEVDDVDADVDASAADDETADTEVSAKAPIDDEAAQKKSIFNSEDEEKADAIAKKIISSGDTKDFLRHALSRPADELRDAHKAIEKEGEEAWKNVNVAKNPHKQGTPAWRLWNKGHINMAKVIFGIKDKPSAAKKKKR